MRSDGFSFKFWQLQVKHAKMIIHKSDGTVEKEQDVSPSMQRGSYFFKAACDGTIHQTYFTHQDTADVIMLKHDMANTFNHHKPTNQEQEDLLQTGSAVYYAVLLHSVIGTGATRVHGRTTVSTPRCGPGPQNTCKGTQIPTITAAETR